MACWGSVTLNITRYDLPMKRKPKTDAERARAYRLRHRKVKSVRLTVIDDLRQEIIRRKAKIAVSGGKPIDQLLRVLELMSYAERQLAMLTGSLPGNEERVQ
jgi:hypothetical protein